MSDMFDGIMEGLNDIVAYQNGDKTRARSRIRETPPEVKPVVEYSKEEIKDIRISLNLSQRTFADILGVSQRTVEAWESGANSPAGSSSRIIEWIEKDNSILEHCGVLISH